MASTNYLRMQNISIEDHFTCSLSILTSVYDAIDQNVFNCNLDGIKLEWCDKLKSQVAITYQQSTYTKNQVYIRCSKQWLKNCTRKQFVEAILYEMLDLYLSVNTSVLPIGKKNDTLHTYLLECAFRYLNERFGTNLKINQNYDNSTSDANVKEILDSLATERKISKKKALIDGFKAMPTMKIINKKLTGNINKIECKNNCDLICYCGPQTLFRQRFFGANIYAIFTTNETVKCILCEKEMKPDAMNDHIDNDCFIFKPTVASTVSVNGF